MSSDGETRALILHLALENAAKFGGKTSPGIVMGHLVARRPDLKQRSGEILKIVADVCREVNSMSMDEISSRLSELGEVPTTQIEKKEVQDKLELQPNPGIRGFVLRFAPNPNGPLTLGHARAALLCDHFAKKYNGTFILRFEDTSPSVKPPLLEAYDWILGDLYWLGIGIDEIYYQSDRLHIYYAGAEKLLSMGAGYVCRCPREEFSELVKNGRPCPHRDQSPEENMRLWKAMLDGEIRQGEAVVRVKTELTHPNPALRDWPALRIDETTHPRVGKKYRVWPLYNWACAIDDHAMKITHVIRAKEHLTNDVRQSYVYKHFGWKKPTTVTIGRVKLEGYSLSKSKMMEGLKAGEYSGFDDPRLGTVRSVIRKGIKAEVIRNAVLDLGTKSVEATLKWENLYSANRTLIDGATPRLFFVENPVILRISGVKEAIKEIPLPNHPDNKDLGERRVPIEIKDGVLDLYLASLDLFSFDVGHEIRLMGLFNVRVDSLEQEISRANALETPLELVEKAGVKIVQWVPVSFAVQTEVLMSDATITRGLTERNVLQHRKGEMAQFVRFGFVKLEKLEEDSVSAVFAHR